jgi:hypothetical protein
MRLAARLISTFFLLCIAAFFIFILPKHSSWITTYDEHIYYPLQYMRGFVLDFLPISLGDILYVVGGFWLLVVVVKWIYYLFNYGTYGHLLGLSIVGTINKLIKIYLLFILGWGANYYKPTVAKSWNLETIRSRSGDSVRLVAYDQFLVQRLNAYAPGYKPRPFGVVNHQAEGFYASSTDTKVKPHGLHIKPTLYAWFMQRLAIDGYYNPFTGEGQVDEDLPPFMLPFVVCHEMAHQAGVAAEGDANLVSYALCTTVGDSTFRYSGYLNLWLYAHNRLYYRDSALARQLSAGLNPLTKAHIDTLKMLSVRYQNEAAKYSSELYDNYLKMQKQEEGIRSYGNVTLSAWQLEEQRHTNPRNMLNIP